MLIDCECCPVRGDGCDDCVIAVLLDRPPVPVEIDAAERHALRRLAQAGLVPPLQPDSRTSDPCRFDPGAMQGFGS